MPWNYRDTLARTAEVWWGTWPKRILCGHGQGAWPYTRKTASAKSRSRRVFGHPGKEPPWRLHRPAARANESSPARSRTTTAKSMSTPASI